MKGIRFYEEYASPRNKRAHTGTGNVFALFTDVPTFWGSQGQALKEGLGSLFDHPNSAVCGSNYDIDILRTHCRHISEQRAREIHPALFERLDETE